MASRDLHYNISPKRAISPVSVSDNTALVSQIINLAGHESLEFVILAGQLADADATFTVLVEDGAAPNLSDASAVDDKFLLGTEAQASFKFDSDDKVFKIGYVGPKQYVRLTITPAANTGAALIAAVAVLGHPRNRPASNPPA